MRVLVTRPLDDAARTARRLTELGHHSLLAPLLEIRVLGAGGLKLDDICAIIATSSNGVRALAQQTQRRDLPLYAVGEQTARTARQLGFSKVKTAGGNADALAVAIPRWIAPGPDYLLHVSGNETPGSLAQALERKGYNVRTTALYRAVPVQEIPEPAKKALQAQELDAVLFFSPKTARTFVELMNREGLTAYCSGVIACCISEAAAAAAESLPFQEVRRAPRPDQERLLSLLY